MDKEEYVIRKRKLQDKYSFPDTNFSPHLWVDVFNHIEMLEDRIAKLEKKVK